MYYVYLLKSVKDGATYIGYTRNLQRRVEEHRSGVTYTTRRHLPVELVYYEAYKSITDAKNREKGLKSHGRALAQLRRRLKCSLGE